MLRSDYADQNCSAARTLEVVGERWTILILRDAFLGVRRFEIFQKRLGIARNVLQNRLERLLEAGVMRRELYQERPERFEYRLTRKGVDLWPVLVSLMEWGDTYAAPADGPPVLLTHKECGGEINGRRVCQKCGAEVDAWDAQPKVGPGAVAGQLAGLPIGVGE